MSPEPLKDKAWKRNNWESMYSDIDILSAIRWLKERVYDLYSDEHLTEGQADDVEHFIDKAFEDVIKK